MLAAIDTVQVSAHDAVHQHCRGAWQDFLLTGAPQQCFDALQRVRQGGDYRLFARFDQNSFHCKTSDFVISSG